MNADSQAVSLPVEQHEAATEQSEQATIAETASKEPSVSSQTPATSAAPSETAATPRQPAEESAVPVHASTASQRSRTNTVTSTASTATSRPATRSSAAPAPALPSMPKSGAKDAKPARAEKPVNGDVVVEASSQDATAAATKKPAEPESEVAEAPAPPVKLPPSSWANLFAKPAAASAAKASATNGAVVGDAATNGHSAEGVVSTTNGSTASFSKANANSVAEAIQSFHVGLADQLSFLEPRGLINTGNMCYMNSVGDLTPDGSNALTRCRCFKF